MGSRGRRLRESSVEADAIFAAGSISEALQYGCGTSEHERNVHEEEDGGETARTALVMSESRRVLFGLGFLRPASSRNCFRDAISVDSAVS